MFGKLAGLAQAARDAVSDVKLEGVKGAVLSTVEAVKDRVGDAADGVGNRLVHPAEAYDRALADVKPFLGPAADDILDELTLQNPYR